MSPTGLDPGGSHLRNAGYIPGPEVGYVIGENLAWGTLDLATPQAIVAAWIASPEHLANILEGQYRETGIGVVPQRARRSGRRRSGSHLLAGVRRHPPLRARAETGCARHLAFATLRRPEKGGGPNVE